MACSPPRWRPSSCSDSRSVAIGGRARYSQPRNSMNFFISQLPDRCRSLRHGFSPVVGAPPLMGVAETDRISTHHFLRYVRARDLIPTSPGPSRLPRSGFVQRFLSDIGRGQAALCLP